MQDHKGDPNIKSRRLRRLKESSRERAYTLMPNCGGYSCRSDKLLAGGLCRVLFWHHQSCLRVCHLVRLLQCPTAAPFPFTSMHFSDSGAAMSPFRLWLPVTGGGRSAADYLCSVLCSVRTEQRNVWHGGIRYCKSWKDLGHQDPEQSFLFPRGRETVSD